ncbi:MAG: glycosyltransferase family 2 protein [Myxococcales bacterium FL481]|nr:MAG: glycosyltransferase family 2 protein [Myxococcales bacterium FL481]
MRLCGLVPTYNNPDTVAEVVERIRPHVQEVILVDDGSAAAGRAACEQLSQRGLAHVVHRRVNGGKGAAVKTGFHVAKERGYSHALQLDADGQHDAKTIPAFVAAARREPDAFVVGYPIYDASAPRGRLWARKITQFWVDLETGRGTIRDAMVGFRVYPIAMALAVEAEGDRMDFDVEIAVRLAWARVPIVNLPVPIRYLTPEEGGVSHFQPLRDNLRFSWLHTRLCTQRWFDRARLRLGS